ncbi:WD-40 repeat-containing protein [Lactifluus subvellereus]|nr:WD-40 repeat-containing protein [Lactifluus subvellereus]
MHLSIDTVLPADSVEFCPHPDASNILVCGTYKLEDQQGSHEKLHSPDSNSPTSAPASQFRRGQCLVFEVDSEQDISVTKAQEISLPAILDLKWCHTTPSRQPLLAVADAEGCVNLFEWELEQKQLRSAGPLRVAPSQVLCLSLDWSNRRVPTSVAGSLVVSLSDGNLVLLEPDQTGQFAIMNAWAAHSHEPWCVAWNYWDANVIYSGGDDLRLKVWDIRQGFEQPIITNKRFDAGVTSIQSHPNIEHLIAVGSYDSTVRLFDARKPLTPLIQADVGGGAWRVKWHPSPSRVQDLLVAAMHDGFKIVSFHDIGCNLGSPSNENAENWEIRKRHDEHKSLAYGVDWSHQCWQAQSGQTLIASASFYDHALHLWRG